MSGASYAKRGVRPGWQTPPGQMGQSAIRFHSAPRRSPMDNGKALLHGSLRASKVNVYRIYYVLCLRALSSF
jgi:hypothetical protein